MLLDRGEIRIAVDEQSRERTFHTRMNATAVSPSQKIFCSNEQ